MMKKVFKGAFWLYKTFVSPLVKRLFGGGCKFAPTCSEYALCAIGSYGILKATPLIIKRLLRCHPFAKYSFDPLK